MTKKKMIKLLPLLGLAVAVPAIATSCSNIKYDGVEQPQKKPIITTPQDPDKEIDGGFDNNGIENQIIVGKQYKITFEINSKEHIIVGKVLAVDNTIVKVQGNLDNQEKVITMNVHISKITNMEKL